MTVRTRFAPSPTGYIHLGGIRTALFAWAYARNQNGTFILRIEDTDKKREVEGTVQHIMDSLTWLGLNWDEGPGKGDHGPYLQSERLEVYRRYAQQLIDAGHAYADPYSEAELAEFRTAAQQAKRPFLYRQHRPENPPTWDGSQPLRFKVPEVKRYDWHDEVKGNLSAGEEALDDFVLIKADGYPTYNFAHIVDDKEMQITHVMRGEEFVASTPKFLSLLDAFGWDYPKFVTLPPVLNATGGRKMSKRDGAKDVLNYRDEGYLPEAVINFLASLGWNDGTTEEIFTPEEIIARFTLDRIQASPARFDQEKLDWLNWQHILRRINQANPLETIKQVAQDQALIKKFEQNDPAYLSDAIRLAATKANSTDTLLLQIQIFINDVKLLPTTELLESIDKSLKPDQAKELLELALAVIEPLENPNSSDFEQALRGQMAEHDLQPRIFLNLVRWAISGQRISPGLFEMMALLGQTETIKRIKSALSQVESEPN